MELKLHIFYNTIGIQDELAMTVLDGLFLKETKIKDFLIFPQNTNSGLEIVVSNFQQDTLNNFENIAFLRDTDLCQTFKYFHV